MGNTLDQDIAIVSGDQTIVTNIGLSKVEATGIDDFRLVDGSISDSKVGGLEILESSG